MNTNNNDTNNVSKMTMMETLLKAKRLGRCILIKRKSKGAAKPSWRLAKVSSVYPESGTVKVVEFKTLKIASIHELKELDGGEVKV